MQPSKASFVTTQWSVVLAAKDHRCPAGRQALETLCRTYWYPLYAYVRRSGYGSQDAEDLTQAFLTKLIEKNLVQAATRAGERPPGVYWLKAWAWTAWVVAIPVVGFGLFFLRSFVSERGSWNPAADEAVVVPLTWLGSLLLPVSG